MFVSNYNPQNYTKATKPFSAESCNMTECHFWTNLMLRQPHVRVSRVSPAQELQGLRVLYSKNFSRTNFFLFSGNSSGR